MRNEIIYGPLAAAVGRLNRDPRADNIVFVVHDPTSRLTTVYFNDGPSPVTRFVTDPVGEDMAQTIGETANEMGLEGKKLGRVRIMRGRSGEVTGAIFEEGIRTPLPTEGRGPGASL